ncbi:MAG: hypothetical protein ACRYFX_23435 [Janthinobacterium lividum]
MARFFWGWLPAALLTARLAAAAPAPADTTDAPPRLTVGFTAATRTTYLQRAPEKADDNGFLGTTFTYQAPRGFIGSLYLNHSFAYTNTEEPFFNYGEVMAGWQSVSTSSTYWTVQYTHLFVYDESTLVQTSLRNDFSASLTQYFDYLTASLSADVFVGNKSDVILTLDLGHQFQLPMAAHDTLSLEPTVELGLGSQRFYAASLGKTTVVKKRRGTTVFTEPATPGFSTLGFTFSAPLTYATGRFSFAATPSYLVPLHVPTGGNDQSLFYLTVGVTRSFW